MSAHNAISDINDYYKAGGTTVADFSNEGIAADTIAESTAATGVTIDGVLMKDNGITTGTSGTITTGNAGTITTGASGHITAGSAGNVAAGAGGNVTAATGLVSGKNVQVTGSNAVTATTGGGTTGLIPAGASFVTVTSDSADKQISLPAGTVGHVIRILVGATGCELIAVTAADKVNNVTVGATNEAALTATNLYICEYVAANSWIVRGFTKEGADQAALVPDAL